jgi:hypothetical protein
MSDIKDIYRISSKSSIDALVTELNRLLHRISDRFDQIEGRRGIPTFYSSSLRFANMLLTSTSFLKAINGTDMEPTDITNVTDIYELGGHLTNLSHDIQIVDISDYDGEVIHAYPLEWSMYNSDVFGVIGDEIDIRPDNNPLVYGAGASTYFWEKDYRSW